MDLLELFHENTNIKDMIIMVELIKTAHYLSQNLSMIIRSTISSIKLHYSELMYLLNNLQPFIF